MKTIEEFIKEIDDSKELQREFGTLKNKEAFTDFLEKYDVSGTADDFSNALMAKVKQKLNLEGREGELRDDEAEAVAGGFFCQYLEWFC